jgi:hypothetical protein
MEKAREMRAFSLSGTLSSLSPVGRVVAVARIRYSHHPVVEHVAALAERNTGRGLGPVMKP